MSSIAEMDSGNSETLGPKASNVAMRWGTVRGGSTYESVLSSHSSTLEDMAAAAGRRDEEATARGLAAKAISKVRGT